MFKYTRQIHFVLYLIFYSSFFAKPTLSENEIPQETVTTSLQQIEIENKTVFALSYKNAVHWHTYWINPGDAGLPTEIKPDGFQIKEYPWPIPKRFIERGDILAYGYDGVTTRFFEIPDKKNGDLKIQSIWLACKHVCIPGKVDIEFTIQEGKLKKTNTRKFVRSENDLIQSFYSLPKKKGWPSNLDIVLKKGEKANEIIAYYNFPNPIKKKLTSSLGILTPYRTKLLAFSRESLFQNKQGDLFGKISLEWDGEYLDPPQAFPSNGKFETPITLKFLFQDLSTGEVSVIEKAFQGFDLAGNEVNETLLKTMTFLAPNSPQTDSNLATKEYESSLKMENKSTEATPISRSFLSILILALIGGLILNVMPCVLPVISLKLFGLIGQSGDSRKAIFKHNLFYTLGVLFTFLILALSILAIKSTGESVGWGFQLQSPVFVSLMIIILFVFSLNLFGLFELSTPGGKHLGNIKLKDGVVGDFVGGVLATILSTPCSAPFLGTALTFAFSASPFEIILVFQVIGIGLSLPFIITGLFPSLVKFLPRPGLWMENVKKFLGLTLLLTTLWLMDVFIGLTDGSYPLMILCLGLILIFFSLYFKKHMSTNKFWKTVFFVIALLPFLKLYQSNLSSSEENTELIKEKNAYTDIFWEKWSEKKMIDYKNQKELVFIDFTAKWCLTCKVNEKLVLETSGFRELVKEKNIKLLLGDWTKYDPKIGSFLKKHNLVGVPAYFIQRPNGELIKLGETITLSKIRNNL